MSFTTENRTLKDIFSRVAQYTVPRYQRDYVWTTTNWRELFVDISFTLSNKNEIEWSHFLGTIVLNNAKKPNLAPGIDEYEIIDGQQRLTTIFLMTSCVYRRLKELENDEANARAEYIYSQFLTSLSANNSRILKISNADHQMDLQDAVQSCKDGIEPKAQNVFIDCMAYFQECFSSMQLNELDTFFNKMMSANIVEIISSNDEEIYNIFEVLNARGCQLKQIELLKNHVLKYLQPREDDILDKAKGDWNEIESLASKNSDPDDFINHFAKAYIEKPAQNAGEVYRLIKEEIEIDSLPRLLCDLKRFAESYESVVTSESSAAIYFKIKRNKQIRPLLTSIELKCREGVITEKDKNSAFDNLGNFFFLFNTLDLTSNRTDRPIAIASFRVYHSNTSVEIKMALTELFYKINQFLDYDSFANHLNTNNSLHYSNKNRTQKKNSTLVKYVLVRLCNYLQTDLVLDPDILSIEHIVCDDGLSQTSALANLTLTSPDINQKKLGNNPVEDKLSYLQLNSNIEMNRCLSKYLTDDGSFDVARRNCDIAKMLCEDVFPFNPAIFGISADQLARYRDTEQHLSDCPELLSLLHSYGINFEKKLSQDPSLAKERELFRDFK